MSIATGSVNTGVSLPNLPPNRCVFVESITVHANFYSRAQINWGAGIRSDAANYPLIYVNTAPGVTTVIPIRRFMRQAEMAYGFIGINVRQLLNADGSAATTAITATGNLSLSVSGYVMYDDLNFSADKIIFFNGDSIFNGTGRTKKYDMYDWMIRNFYSEAGQSVRATMFAASGSNSSEHEAWRYAGMFDRPQIDLWVYEPMVNDAVQLVSAAVYGSNLQKAIDYKKTRYPRAKMLVLGCHPLQHAPSEARAVLLRAAAASRVTAAADPLVKFCDLGQLGTTFSTNNANYAASDGVGTGIHTTAQGDAFIFNGNISAGGAFGGIKAFLTANLLTI